MVEIDPETARLLTIFVNLYSDEYDILLDPNPNIGVPLPFRIPIEESEREKAAHYFLFVASINDIEVVGNSRNARVVLSYLYKQFRERLFKVKETAEFEKALRSYEYIGSSYSDLGTLKNRIPSILSSVNKFVENEAPSGLIAYSQKLNSEGKKPADMVEALAKIEKMDGYDIAKPWLYM